MFRKGEVNTHIVIYPSLPVAKDYEYYFHVTRLLVEVHLSSLGMLSKATEDFQTMDAFIVITICREPSPTLIPWYRTTRSPTEHYLFDKVRLYKNDRVCTTRLVLEDDLHTME